MNFTNRQDSITSHLPRLLTGHRPTSYISFPNFPSSNHLKIACLDINLSLKTRPQPKKVTNNYFDGWIVMWEPNMIHTLIIKYLSSVEFDFIFESVLLFPL